jgi:LIVCS family branched-chain amino acid:cation transporter
MLELEVKFRGSIMQKLKSNTLSTGLAIFSMFFGAGNLVFPLAAGQFAQDQNFYSSIGLLITAVGVPFLGLLSMTLFDGNYQVFFSRIGKIPGFLACLFIMLLIGPLGALPRVITFAHSTVEMFLPNIPLVLFSLVACTMIFLLTFRQSKILDILGYILTPVLLGSLAILIIRALFTEPDLIEAEESPITIFLHGMYEGYNTMDLMGAFFFSSVVILCLKKELSPSDQKDLKKIVKMTVKAGCIGATLLGLVYLGFSYVAAYNSEFLAAVPKEQMLGALAIKIMGNYAGIIAIVAVTLACLTTAIALAAIFAEFIHKDITKMKISYRIALIFTLILTFFISTLNFEGIMNYLQPILIICYPALIMLSFVSLLYKLYGFKYVKVPVAATLFVSFIAYLF